MWHYMSINTVRLACGIKTDYHDYMSPIVTTILIYMLYMNYNPQWPSLPIIIGMIIRHNPPQSHIIRQQTIWLGKIIFQKQKGNNQERKMCWKRVNLQWSPTKFCKNKIRLWIKRIFSTWPVSSFVKSLKLSMQRNLLCKMSTTLKLNSAVEEKKSVTDI